jgi:hypothetical protein
MQEIRTDPVQPDSMPKVFWRADSRFGDQSDGLNCVAGNPFDTYTPVLTTF